MAAHLTGKEAAELLGISRRTLYRWAEMGRIPSDWWRLDLLAPYIGIPKLSKGPPRRRDSLRYTVYRHRFNRNLPQRIRVQYVQ